MKNILTWLIKKPLFWALAMEFVLIVFLFSSGFKIVYAPELKNDWEAVSAIGQWANAVAAILIPVAAVFLSAFLSQKIDESKKDIGASNVATVEEIEAVKKDIEDIRNNIFSKLSIGVESFKSEPNMEEIYEKNKEKAHKYVNISMFAKTEDIAKHLGIGKEEAFDILNELFRHDGKITCGGRATKDNMDNVIWLKK